MTLKSLVTIFFVIVFVGAAQAATEKFPVMGRVKSDRVYVRAGQNVNFEVTGTVNKGDTLVLLSKSFGWYKVKLPPQAKAYVKAEYTQSIGQDAAEITGDRVNVRSGPNANATVIGKLEKGNRFYVRSKDGDWLLIKPLDAFTGWVKEEFVDVQAGLAVPAKLYSAPPSGEKMTASAPVVPLRPLLIKKLEDNRVEAQGMLKKEGNLYRIYKDGTAACVLKAPAEILEGFVGSVVKVTGTLDAGDPAVEPVVSVKKINFVL